MVHQLALAWVPIAHRPRLGSHTGERRAAKRAHASTAAGSAMQSVAGRAPHLCSVSDVPFSVWVSTSTGFHVKWNSLAVYTATCASRSLPARKRVRACGSSLRAASSLSASRSTERSSTAFYAFARAASARIRGAGMHTATRGGSTFQCGRRSSAVLTSSALLPRNTMNLYMAESAATGLAPSLQGCEWCNTLPPPTGGTTAAAGLRARDGTRKNKRQACVIGQRSAADALPLVQLSGVATQLAAHCTTRPRLPRLEGWPPRTLRRRRRRRRIMFSSLTHCCSCAKSVCVFPVRLPSALLMACRIASRSYSTVTYRFGEVTIDLRCLKAASTELELTGQIVWPAAECMAWSALPPSVCCIA